MILVKRKYNLYNIIKIFEKIGPNNGMCAFNPA
jgi:hypothetical protein